MRTAVFCFLLVGCSLISCAFEADVPVAPATSEALRLIQRVSQQYENAKTYRIEVVEERITASELRRSWERNFMFAAEAPSNRYRFEGRGESGSATIVSDGATEWRFHASDGLYTAKPVSGAKPKGGTVIVEDEYVLMEARNIRKRIARLARTLNSARLLKNENINVAGRKIECRVLRFDQNDLKTRREVGASEEQTLWIDKDRNVILKSVEKSRVSVRRRNGTSFPMHVERTVTYPVIELDQDTPSSLFAFTPPQGARLVAEFADPMRWDVDPSADAFLGKPAPELRLKSGDGTEQALSSLRGKTVLLDFWASSCRPCVSALPELVKLHDEAKGTDLVIISIDNDEEPERAAALLKDKSIPWSNYHDSDATLGGAYKRMGIPLGVLINREGNVVFYKAGYSVTELRESLAKLGPEFASLAPQQKPRD